MGAGSEEPSKPQSRFRNYSFFGGTRDDYVQTAALNRTGELIFTGAGASADFPTAGIAEQRKNSTFVAKLDSSLSTLSYSTFLNNFQAIRIFPDTEGKGYTLIGNGQPTGASNGPNAVLSVHVAETLAFPGAPRIDSVRLSPPPDRTIEVTGKYINANSIVYLGDNYLSTQFVRTGVISATVPQGTPNGEYALHVEGNGKSSQYVKVFVEQ